MSRWLSPLVAFLLIGGVAQADPARVRHARVLILSTNVADRETLAEWGFSALVEADGKKILFDTGKHPETMLRNLEQLKVDLSGVTDVVLSHAHNDHTGGLLALRRALKQHPEALSRAHIGHGFFDGKHSPRDPNGGFDPADRKAYEQGGGRFVEHAGPVALAPGVWLIGPIARTHPERNYPDDVVRDTPRGRVPDRVDEEIALVLDTTAGLVVITGCGHSGAVNTVEAARAAVRAAPLTALIGGIHLFNAKEEVIEWTAAQLRRLELKQLLAAHCTGPTATLRLRALLGLDVARCPIATAGAIWDSERGIQGIEFF